MPGYEAIDPNDPSKYVGFDIWLGEAIGPGRRARSQPVEAGGRTKASNGVSSYSAAEKADIGVAHRMTRDRAPSAHHFVVHLDRLSPVDRQDVLRAGRHGDDDIHLRTQHDIVARL